MNHHHRDCALHANQYKAKSTHTKVRKKHTRFVLSFSSCCVPSFLWSSGQHIQIPWRSVTHKLPKGHFGSSIARHRVLLLLSFFFFFFSLEPYSP